MSAIIHKAQDPRMLWGCGKGVSEVVVGPKKDCCKVVTKAVIIA